MLIALGACRFHFDPIDDGGTDGLNPNAPRCGGISRLSDEFTDGVFDDDLWGNSYADPPASYREENGELVITPAANQTQAYAAYSTQRFYDAREQRVAARVTQVPATNALMGMLYVYDTNIYIGITLTEGELRVDQRNEAVFDYPATIPFDPQVHKYWAMSERGGRVYFETSTDGVSFDSFYDMEPPFSLYLVRLSLFAGTNVAVAAPGEARFDVVGGAGAMSLACSLETAVDDFEDNFEGKAWDISYADACCSVNEMGGELVLATDGTIGTAARRSSMGFDLRGSGITIELLKAPAVGGTNGTVTLRRSQDTFAAIQIGDPTAVQAQLALDGSGPAVNATRMVGERYLRIRETGDRLYWELSADKQTWREIRNDAPTFPIDDVMIVLRVGATVMTAADSVRFDNLNAP